MKKILWKNAIIKPKEIIWFFHILRLYKSPFWLTLIKMGYLTLPILHKYNPYGPKWHNIEKEDRCRRPAMNKPSWWPECPYPESVFTMDIKEYPKIVPDEEIRTALSGCLGRHFWNLASDAIWRSWKENSDE